MSESKYDCEVVGEKVEGAKATYWFLQVRVGPDVEMLYGVYDNEDDLDRAVAEAGARGFPARRIIINSRFGVIDETTMRRITKDYPPVQGLDDEAIGRLVEGARGRKAYREGAEDQRLYSLCQDLGRLTCDLNAYLAHHPGVPDDMLEKARLMCDWSVEMRRFLGRAPLRSSESVELLIPPHTQFFDPAPGPSVSKGWVGTIFDDEIEWRDRMIARAERLHRAREEKNEKEKEEEEKEKEEAHREG